MDWPFAEWSSRSAGFLPPMPCEIACGAQARSWDSAGARPTMITPTTSAAMPPAWTASMPSDTWIRSPNTMTPSRMPTSGSPAEMAGSDTWSGPELNALCISQMPIAPAPTSAYGAHEVSRLSHPLDWRICSVCLVSASWIPKIRPAATPVSNARVRLRLRLPACTATNAMAAIAAAAGQCDTEPNDRPIGVTDRDDDSSATPVHNTAAPSTSQSLTDAFASGTASTSAKTRFVASSGSTNDNERWPIDHAASTMPPTMHAMPTSHRGVRARSIISRRLRNREAGSR